MFIGWCGIFRRIVGVCGGGRRRLKRGNRDTFGGRLIFGGQILLDSRLYSFLRIICSACTWLCGILGQRQICALIVWIWLLLGLCGCCFAVRRLLYGCGIWFNIPERNVKIAKREEFFCIFLHILDEFLNRKKLPSTVDSSQCGDNLRNLHPQKRSFLFEITSRLTLSEPIKQGQEESQNNPIAFRRNHVQYFYYSDPQNPQYNQSQNLDQNSLSSSFRLNLPPSSFLFKNNKEMQDSKFDATNWCWRQNKRKSIGIYGIYGIYIKQKMNCHFAKGIFVAFLLAEVCLSATGLRGTAGRLLHEGQERSHYHHWDFEKNNAFEVAGVREPELSRVNYARSELLEELNKYFRRRSYGDKWSLYVAVLNFKKILDVIEKKYWSQYDNIVVGTGNSLNGHENFLSSNGMSVTGNENIVLGSQYNNVPLNDENVIRISRYDVDLDEIDLIKTDPTKAITLLSKNGQEKTQFRSQRRSEGSRQNNERRRRSW